MAVAGAEKAPIGGATDIRVIPTTITPTTFTEDTADIRSRDSLAATPQLTRHGTRAPAAALAMAAAGDVMKAVADMVSGAGNVVAEDTKAAMEGVMVMAIKLRKRDQAMHRKSVNNCIDTRGWLTQRVSLAGLVVLGLVSASAALAQAPGQKTFNSATEASDAFAAAIHEHDEGAMLAILGLAGKDLISSGDPVADRNKQDTFSANYRASHQFAAAGDGRTFLYIGLNNWPTPIPLQKNEAQQWYFDTDYGKQEILYRRIGSDELNVIKVCTAIVDAQQDYYATLHDGAAEHQYAQRFRSTAGTQNGLYWEVKAGAQPPESPLGPLVAEAAIEGYQHHAAGQPHPFHGYLYRLLTSQGANAPAGARNYIVNGKMTGGFGLVAYPVSYRDSGVMTFIVNQDGQIYQKDLGPQTSQIAGAMVAYEPDATWHPAKTAAFAKLK